MKTGWEPSLLQDDSRKLSDWFASRVDARWVVRQVCADIERKRMNEKPEALRLADELDADPMVIGYDQAAALLRNQHEALQRKDALLRQCMEALFTYDEDWPDDGEGGITHRVLYDQDKVVTVIWAIRKELQ